MCAKRTQISNSLIFEYKYGEESEMPNIEIKFKVTLELNEKWASNQTTEELVDYLKARLNSSLGFRGQIRKLNLVAR